MVQHHKRECSVEKWDYCIQGQDHSKGSKCQCMFVQIVSSTADHFDTKLGMVMRHYEPECHAEKMFTVFKVSVTVKDHIIKICFSNMSS